MSTHFDQIKSMFDRFAAAWKTNDGAAVAGFFVEDGVLVNPLGERADGRAAVAAMYSQYFGGMLRGTSTTINLTSVRDIGNSHAFADSEQTVCGPDGQVVLTLRLAALLHSEGDGWRFVDSRPYTLLTIPAEKPGVNIETVRQIYAAFGQGDIPAILDKLGPVRK